jgi:hypothetical protein
MIERILPLAEKVKDNWSLCEFFADMGNRASEKEYMVAETIHACKINYAQHGECFSFKGKLQNGGNGLVDNTTAYGWLVSNNYFAEEKHNQRTVIIPTPKLLDRLEWFFSKEIK